MTIHTPALALVSINQFAKRSDKMSNSMKSMRVAKGMSRSFCFVLLLFTCGVLSAQNQEHRVRNIVLVHGAWADGSGWEGVYDILVKDGYNVSIVQEPETSFKDDVAATKRTLALQDGPCILVAHSYGGAVITEAGTDPSVAGLVYVAAHMPDAGENEADDGKRFPSDLSKSGAIKKTADGFTYLDPAQFHEYFAADLSADQAAFMAIAGTQLSRQFQSRHHHRCVEKQSKLDVGSGSRPNHQPGPPTLVCNTSQEPQDRSRWRQPFGLRLQAQGGCSSDRRSCDARSVRELAMAGITSLNTPPTAAIYLHRNLPSPYYGLPALWHFRATSQYANRRSASTPDVRLCDSPALQPDGCREILCSEAVRLPIRYNNNGISSLYFRESDRCFSSSIFRSVQWNYPTRSKLCCLPSWRSPQ